MAEEIKPENLTVEEQLGNDLKNNWEKKVNNLAEEGERVGKELVNQLHQEYQKRLKEGEAKPGKKSF